MGRGMEVRFATRVFGAASFFIVELFGVIVVHVDSVFVIENAPLVETLDGV